MADGLTQVTYGYYMICRASLEAKPFILHFLYSFYQEFRLNLLLAVPAFQEEGSGTLGSTAGTSELQTGNTI